MRCGELAVLVVRPALAFESAAIRDAREDNPRGEDAGVSFLSAAEFVAKLNRRHQAALCATLVCVGLILLLGGKVRDAVGISFLGIAFSWALGSNKRLVHWLFLLFGLLLLFPPILYIRDWPETKRELIGNYSLQIETDNFIIQSAMKDPETFGRGEIPKAMKDRSEAQQEVRTLELEGAVRHVMKNDWGSVLGGLLLLTSGLGLIVGVKPVRQNQPELPQ